VYSIPFVLTATNALVRYGHTDIASDHLARDLLDQVTGDQGAFAVMGEALGLVSAAIDTLPDERASRLAEPLNAAPKAVDAALAAVAALSLDLSEPRCLHRRAAHRALPSRPPPPVAPAVQPPQPPTAPPAPPGTEHRHR